MFNFFTKKKGTKKNDNKKKIKKITSLLKNRNKVTNLDDEVYTILSSGNDVVLSLEMKALEGLVDNDCVKSMEYIINVLIRLNLGDRFNIITEHLMTRSIKQKSKNIVTLLLKNKVSLSMVDFSETCKAKDITKTIIRFGHNFHLDQMQLQSAISNKNEDAAKSIIKRNAHITLPNTISYFISCCFDKVLIEPDLIKIGKYLFEETEVYEKDLIFAKDKYETNKNNIEAKIFCYFYVQIRNKVNLKRSSKY